MASTSPAFNNARIRNHEDKVLLTRITEYFEAFANADATKMDNMVADDYHMSDIPLGIVRSPKETWFQQNKGFGGLMKDISVEAISLHGSSEPGSCAVLESVTRFTLKIDPPEAAKPNLPPWNQGGRILGYDHAIGDLVGW
ncbi:uncharacterized protein N7503_001529 [Penicillium pulvis]|uniref:uncharacterized protein n=1 Tax=Penicillium pulvis TaxID=1562058 RepID=UPI002546F709|nr:uncharacterized protein N7503_001529 [Penicillium pulvis]KAJ5809311.1 hypothetical protein N7503_001529 [Penicillium pulvis]